MAFKRDPMKGFRFWNLFETLFKGPDFGDLKKDPRVWVHSTGGMKFIDENPKLSKSNPPGFSQSQSKCWGKRCQGHAQGSAAG